MFLYARDIPTGWVAFFRGGLELEVDVTGWAPVARWSTMTGHTLGAARWGRA